MLSEVWLHFNLTGISITFSRSWFVNETNGIICRLKRDIYLCLWAYGGTTQTKEASQKKFPSKKIKMLSKNGRFAAKFWVNAVTALFRWMRSGRWKKTKDNNNLCSLVRMSSKRGIYLVMEEAWETKLWCQWFKTNSHEYGSGGLRIQKGGSCRRQWEETCVLFEYSVICLSFKQIEILQKEFLLILRFNCLFEVHALFMLAPSYLFS